MLPTLTKNELLYKIKFEREKIIHIIVDIIKLHKNHEIKKLYCQCLCDFTKDNEIFNEFDNLCYYIEEIYKFISIKLHKMIISKGALSRYDYYIIFFLKLLSNCSLYGKRNQNIGLFINLFKINFFFQLK